LIKSVILKRLLLTSAILLVVDISIGALSGLFHNVKFFSQKSGARVASDLAFLEGAVILFVGAVAAFFSSKPGLREMALIIIGVVMFGMSVVFGMFG
jgi:hypothetical protein